MPTPDYPLEVDCQAVKARLDRGDAFLFVDCREKDEHGRVHIPQAKLLPMSQIQERLAELEPHRDGEIVVHCHHGGRSLKVTQWLRQQGFAKVASMAGGIDQWSIEIDPTLPRY